MLTYEKTKHCYTSIRNAELLPQLHPLRRDLYLKALDYARIRTEWMISTREQRMDMEERRTLAHNAFIDSANILSRNMGNNGGDNSWQE